MEIVKIDHQEYGLEEKKAKQISDMFKPMLDKMVELEEQANEVLSLPMGPETYTKARELRLEYKRTRTGTATIHKGLKAFYLKGGRFVDGWKNAQGMAAHGMEDKLSAIENHEAIEEQRKIDTLQEKRAKALKKFDLEVVPSNLGELDTVSWNNYLTGTKVNYDKRKKAEKKAEEDRLKQVRVDELTSVRKTETAKYSNFIPEYDTLDLGVMDEKAFRNMLQKASDDLKAKEEQDERNRKELERLQLESKKRDEKEEKERKDNEAKLKKEKDLRRKAELDLKTKKDEDDRKAREEEERLQGDLNQDDSTKVESLVKNLEHLAQMYTFKSEKNQKMYDGVGILISKIIKYIQG